ncbi:MAG: tetratricopeptide repeat protein [Prevotella sp.]|nr:tetratricopeptide repeat protein [Prevotella sp.]
MAKENLQQQGATNLEETLSKNEAWFLKNKKMIVGCVCAVIVIVAGAVMYHNFVSVPGEEKASTELAKAQQLFAQQRYEQALKGDSTGVVGFEQIAKEHGGTDAGNLAKLYAGLCNANLSKWEEAVKCLEDFSARDDQMISPAALGALGNAYAHLNQLDKAVTTLKKAAEKADNNSLSPTFLVQAGEILESQGKKEDALKCYQQVKDKYFNSMAYQSIDAYIERVK